MIGAARDAAGEPRATATSPAACGSTRRRSSCPRRDRGKRILVEFEGVYRSARVYVNGTLVGHRPYGYSNFAVSIGEHLRYGEENTIAVDATAHRRRPLVLGRRDLPRRPPRRRRTGARRARRRARDHPRRRRRRRRDRGRDRRGERVDRHDDDDGHDRDRRRHRRRRRHATSLPLTVFPGRPETLRQRLLVARPRRWSVDQPALYTCRTVAGRATAASSTGRRPSSASAPSPSTPSAACASTANPSTCAAPASTTTTACSAARRSPAPTNAGSRSSRKPASTRCAARTTR